MLRGRQSRQGDYSPSLLSLGAQDEAAGLKLLRRRRQRGYLALGRKARRAVKGCGIVLLAAIGFRRGDDADDQRRPSEDGGHGARHKAE